MRFGLLAAALRRSPVEGIDAAMLAAIGHAASGLQNAVSGPLRGVFALDERRHRAFLDSVPGCPAGPMAARTRLARKPAWSCADAGGGVPVPGRTARPGRPAREGRRDLLPPDGLSLPRAGARRPGGGMARGGPALRRGHHVRAAAIRMHARRLGWPMG